MPAFADLYIPTRTDLTLAAVLDSSVRFEGVAVGTGIYVAQEGEHIAITRDHLSLIAERIAGVQIRDLHDERVRATVGAVRDARVAGDDVRFVGEVALQPHATIIRRFPETIAFSVGFRFRREDLVFDERGVAPLPLDFTIDHLAIVGQGQDPDARLTRLLNEAAGQTQRLETTTMENQELDRLRTERDQALASADKAKADLAVAKADLKQANDRITSAHTKADELRRDAENTRLELEAIKEAAEEADRKVGAAELELGRAKSHFANTIIKLELKTDKDVDIDARRDHLLALGIGELDKLRLELAAQAAEARSPDPPSEPATRAGEPRRPDAPRDALDLSQLSLEDTLRLGLLKGVL